jgi:hypothetical protein
MPHLAGKIPDARFRTGLAGARPLAVRFAEARERATREISLSHPLRDCLNLMESEFNIDRIYEAIERYHDQRVRAAQAAEDPMLREARGAVYELIKAWNNACLDIKNAQGWLQCAAKDWRHVLMRHIGANLFTVPEQYSTDLDHIASVRDARLVRTDLGPRVDGIKSIVAAISTAKHFEKLPVHEQSFELIRALANENNAIKSRMAALEAQLSAQATSLKPPKGKSTRSATRKHHNGNQARLTG